MVSGAPIISIHEALASLDMGTVTFPQVTQDFDPRGSREPRREAGMDYKQKIIISIHEALASLDLNSCIISTYIIISIHEALASLDVF